MSLEAALAENTAALKALTEKLGGVAPAAESEKRTRAKAADKPAADTPKAEAKPTIDAKTMAEVVMDIANNYDRDSAVAILNKYGAAKCSEVKPADFAAVFGEATVKRAVLKAAKEAAEKAASNESLV